ncbi:MAG TPA: aminoglycoside phosphotransferase family protein [Pseudomonadales bacterium]
MEIDVPLVRRLVRAQFPAWDDLEIVPVAEGGWDNRTFHLGPSMSVRLPSAAHYAPQVAKEQTWLPKLAPPLPLPIPVPLALGKPGEGYPWSWSVYRWLPGEAAERSRIRDLDGFARDLAMFLRALQGADAHGGPPPGAHSFHRGGDLAIYDRQTRENAAALAGSLDKGALLQIWEAALASRFSSAPTWLHGDVAPGNLLTSGGRLSAVIDFGCCAVGDPACDLAIAWSLFDVSARAVFAEVLALDEETWARGRGWALWKALVELRRLGSSDQTAVAGWRATVASLLDDH